MRITVIIAIICLFVKHQSALAQCSSFHESIRILRVGEFHKSEVNEKSGEKWFCLLPTKAGYELKHMDIVVQPSHDPIVDRDTSVKTGWRVAIKSDLQPIVLIHGMENIKEGPVKTSFFGLSRLVPDNSLIFKLFEGRDYYGIYPNSKSEDIQGGTLYKDYNLKLTFGRMTQIIASLDRLTDDGLPSIIWAGDLDRDGKLDLLLDLTNHYNISQYTLFLSSVAKPGELVRKVADFRRGGC